MHPIAFTIGGFSVHWYSLLMLTAFGLAYGTTLRRAAREGLKPEQIRALACYVLLGAAVGAHLLHVATHWRGQFGHRTWAEVLYFWHGHMFYGGFMGGIAMMALWARLRAVPFWRVADAVAPSLPLGTVFGRLACLMSGCCWGSATSWPWAIHFPAPHATAGTAVHPTQVYHALLSVALYAALERLHRRKAFQGQVFAVLLIGYAVTRAAVEPFRGDYLPAEIHCGLTPGQYMGLPVLIAGIFLYWKLLMLPKAQVAQPA